MIEAAPLQDTSTLLVLGDSLSAAYGIEREKGWVALLQTRFAQQPQTKNWQLINASVSGETTFGGLQRLPALLKQHQPGLLILQLGANDALRGQNLMQTKANLARMIDLCAAQSTPCQTLLLGIRLPSNYGPVYSRVLESLYRDLAKQYTLNFDPFFLEPVALNPDLMQADGLHPNQKAQPQILERLWPRLQIYFPPG
ncbi:MAG: arylesterase [Thiotrichales bacterium]|nr:arylesterase [Thiotrichales bacterium]